MSENVETMRRSVAAVERSDKNAFAELCHSEIEVVPVGDWPEAKIRGRDAVWDFLLAAGEPWEPGHYELNEVTDGGDHVAARMQQDLRGKSSGIKVRYDYWVVFSFRDGEISRVEWFEDRDQALEAAGLWE
jgi:ketosteroid isomerase-like protein